MLHVAETYLLRVGKKGEVYTNKRIRDKTGIKPGGLVKATIKGRALILEPVPTVEDLLDDAFIELTPRELERISEEIQKEKGIYG